MRLNRHPTRGKPPTLPRLVKPHCLPSGGPELEFIGCAYRAHSEEADGQQARSPRHEQLCAGHAGGGIGSINPGSQRVRLCKRVEQRLSCLQVGSVEAFGKPVVDRLQ